MATLQAQAATYYVSPTGNDVNNGTSWTLAKQTIQAGINAATNGDTILVADGAYGPISVSNAITVCSVNGAQATIIDGGGVTNCVTMSGGAVLDGFTVTHGYHWYGGGVITYGGMVANCTISSNQADYGGGLFAYLSMVTNCTISSNQADWYGGVNAWCSTVAVCTISGNQANYIAGVAASYTIVSNCTVNGNQASCWVGGMMVSDSVAVNCTVSGNQADTTGGMDAYDSVAVNCTVSSNQAYLAGGVVACYSIVSNCTVSFNQADSYDGGVAGWFSVVANCTISKNTAHVEGGGLCAAYCSIAGCTISENLSGNRGGGVFSFYNTIENCTIISNTAVTDGGGLFLAYGDKVNGCTILRNVAYLNGGGIFVQTSTVENCTIEENESYGSTWTTNYYDCGGGVYVMEGGKVRNCAINRNLAYWDGGGAFLWGGALENCTLEGNSARSFGGGLSIVNGTARNCVISGNTAVDMGGGVWAAGGEVENCTIVRNTVVSGDGNSGVGGGVFVQGGTIRNCVVYYNQDTDVIGPITYSCLGVSTGGTGNVTNEPLFVANGAGFGAEHVMGNYRLQLSSPCINRALNQSWMPTATDLDGRARIIGDVVDMGAYENTDKVTLKYSPAILSNRCEYGSHVPNQTIALWNLEQRAMEYTLTPNVNWLGVSPSSGAGNGETNLVNVAYAASGLIPGSYEGIITIASPQAYNSPQAVEVYLQVDKLAQTISFLAIPDQIVTSRVVLVATASSGLPVSFTVVSGPGTITGGNNLTFTSAGTVLVVASQAGDATYNPAATVTNAVIVNKLSQTITFPAIADQTVTSRVSLVATASSGLPVSFKVVSGPGTILGGNLTFTTAGTVLVVASQAGNTIYNPASSVTNAITVNKLDQTITFPAIPDQTVVSLVELVATASSGLPVTFTIASGPGTISGASLTFTATGTVKVGASQTGNVIYNPAHNVTNAVIVKQPLVFYVSPLGNDTNDGTSWARAKQTIQAAINVTTDGGTVLVADGTYGPISISKPITVCSANGAETTIIKGVGTTRGVYISNGAVLDGFRVTGGFSDYGGGLYVSDSTVQNCTIIGNQAYYYGGLYAYNSTVLNCTINGNAAGLCGGVYSYDSTFANCTISRNQAHDYGGLYAYNSTVSNCTISENTADYYGGGVYSYDSTFANCTISRNQAYYHGGLYTYNSTVLNCTINGNVAKYSGGVFASYGTFVNCVISGNAANIYYGGMYAYYCIVENCTIVENSATRRPGGVYADGGIVRNCIVYYNQGDDVVGPISNSCIGPSIPGMGNITNEPQFVFLGTGYGTSHIAGNYYLRPGSPCINAGLNQPWMSNAVDLNGLPRIIGGVVDMGAYEKTDKVIIMHNPPILFNRCNYGSNPTSQTLEVWNGGIGNMPYTLSADVNWLSLSPVSGTSAGDIDLVNVDYVAAGLALGTYTGVITITSAEAINSPRTIMVYLANKLDQTISFPAIPDQVVTAQVQLAATASSDLPVSFAVQSGPGIITGGTNLKFTTGGTVRIVASQGGNEIYHPAPSVTNTIVVKRLSQTLTFPAIPQATTLPIGLAATASSGLPVSFAVVSGPGRIIGGTNLEFLTTGTVQVVAKQGGSAIYEPAPNVTNSVTFSRSPMTIYVSPTGNDANDGTSWALAKKTIQAAINMAIGGDTVLVADGTYGPISSYKAITVRSVNGARSTTIDGGGVSRCALIDRGAVLDGFTVTKGYSYYGGGIKAYGGTVVNCTIIRNTANLGGGLDAISCFITDCTVSENRSYGSGGGILSHYNIIENCAINSNTAHGNGGGLFLSRGNTVRHCTISSNTAFGNGGGLWQMGNDTVQNCVISHNGATWGGGDTLWWGGILQDCTIDRNWASYGGGGALNVGGTVQDCVITGNSTLLAEHPELVITYGSCGGGVLAWQGAVQGCTIEGNWTADFGGGVYAVQGTIQNCVINRNGAAFDGGGVEIWSSTLRNCLITGNAANDFGGGLYSSNSTVQNCTISGNEANEGGGLYSSDGNTIQNCIVYYNQNGDVLGSLAGISYSCLGTEITGSGNISSEPQFVSLGAGYGTNFVPGNYRLQPTSLCINVGLNQWWMANASDLDAQARIIGGVVDMGAYEVNAEPRTVQFSTSSYHVNEDAGTVTLTVNRNGGSCGLATVEYATAAGTALDGSDYTSQSGTLSWPDGDASTKTITVSITDDNIDESDETFTVTLSNVTGAGLGLPNVATVTIVDNDNPPTGEIRFAETNLVVNEDAVNVELRVVRTNGDYGLISVGYTDREVTASAGLDYGVVTGQLTWADGDASDKVITISVVDDFADEPDEMFEVVLTNVVGTSIFGTNVVSVTIVDNDNPPAGEIQFAVTVTEVGEASGSMTLSVARIGGSFGAASIDYITADGTASGGSDYTSQSGTLSWLDGDTSSKTITIAITDDSIDESDETFTATLSNATGAGLGSPNVATVTIVDNDIPPDPEHLADLEVSDLKFVPVNLWAGDHPATISFELVNEGSADLVASDAQLAMTFYLSANQTFGDADDIAIGTKIEVLTLPAGSQTTIRYPGRAHNEDVTIPEGLTGDYYVFVNVRLASSAGLSDPDGATAMRDGPIHVRIHPTEDGDDSTRRSVVNDYDGDEQTDMMSYDEPSGEWVIRLSALGESVRFIFGGPGYETVSGDYDGDGLTDPAIHQRQGSVWTIMLSGQGYAAVNFDFRGSSATRGAVGDYTGEGRANPGLYEEMSGRWYVLLSAVEAQNAEIVSAVFGGLGYLPVAGDYDGDGKVDPAVYGKDTGNWMVMLSGQGYGVVSAVFGGPGYAPVVGDYDGDGKADPMLFNQATGEWTALMSANGYAPKRFTSGAGIPVAGDFDGDGIADPAVLSTSGEWSFLSSLSAYARLGPYAITQPR